MIRRFLRLLLGLALYAVGIVLTINAHIGYAPWDVLHAGISISLGMSIGLASILVGLLICIVTWIFKEKIGIGSILNMVLIGVFIDVLFSIKLIPTSSNLGLGILELCCGLVVIAFASYYYISSGFGAGPRDSLMVLLTRKTKLPVGLIRTCLEVFVSIAGWLLGGSVGIGTVLVSLLIGFCVHLVFALLKFDSTKVQHQSIAETIRLLKTS